MVIDYCYFNPPEADVLLTEKPGGSLAAAKTVKMSVEE